MTNNDPPAIVTMGADDLVTNAEDLYGDGPGYIFQVIQTEPFFHPLKLTTARLRLK